MASLDTRARWFRWGAFLAGLTVLGMFTAVQLLLSYWGKGRHLTIEEAFLSGLATWYPWIIFAPMIDALWRRYPIEGPGWKRAIVIHLFTTPLFGICWTTARWGLSFVRWIDPIPDMFGFLENARARKVTLKAWLRSLRGCRVWGIFSLRDPWHAIRAHVMSRSFLSLGLRAIRTLLARACS